MQSGGRPGSPSLASACALSAREGWAGSGIGLGLGRPAHTGEIELAGSDIRGVAIHEASCVLGMAGADEILVSAVTAGMAGDAGIAFEDRGEHDLRGLTGPRRIYAVA